MTNTISPSPILKSKRITYYDCDKRKAVRRTFNAIEVAKINQLFDKVNDVLLGIAELRSETNLTHLNHPTCQDIVPRKITEGLNLRYDDDYLEIRADFVRK